MTPSEITAEIGERVVVVGDTYHVPNKANISDLPEFDSVSPRPDPSLIEA